MFLLFVMSHCDSPACINSSSFSLFLCNSCPKVSFRNHFEYCTSKVTNACCILVSTITPNLNMTYLMYLALGNTPGLVVADTNSGSRKDVGGSCDALLPFIN